MNLERRQSDCDGMRSMDCGTLQVQHDTGSWTNIIGSDATTTSHTVTGLTNGTEYTFMVRAVVGSDSTLVTGVASDAQTATL